MRLWDSIIGISLLLLAILGQGKVSIDFSWPPEIRFPSGPMAWRFFIGGLGCWLLLQEWVRDSDQ